MKTSSRSSIESSVSTLIFIVSRTYMVLMHLGELVEGAMGVERYAP